MTFSVIIPTKNEEKHLTLLLKNIATQTLQPDEIIIADARSIDKTREIAKSLGAIVVDGGLPSVGRNNGAKNASSDLLFFLDADVTLINDSFFKQAIKSFNEQSLSVATMDVIPITKNLFDKLSHKIYNLYVRALSGLLPHAPGFCILIKRDLHSSITGFDERIRFCEDHNYVQRAGKRGRFGFMNGVKIYVSVRRMQEDGRVKIAIKYLLAELHLIFIGPIYGDKFKYNFEHKK